MADCLLEDMRLRFQLISLSGIDSQFGILGLGLITLALIFGRNYNTYIIIWLLQSFIAVIIAYKVNNG